MVQRHHRIDFARGALVFPGGKVDAGDGDAGLRSRVAGAEALEPAALALRIAGVRETFEECGVLLARGRGEPALLSEARVVALEGRYRARLLGGELGIGAIAEREDLELAADLLVPFAHWITPEGAPRRFDTHFYLVEAPQDQVAAHDGSESVDSVWIEPGRALEEGRAGRRTVVFPTRLNLRKLARSRSVQEALERARREPVVTVLPRIERVEGEAVIRIPEAAGYGICEAPLSEAF
jgi:8-oxo-dGTP pyrophosphatase MutT (NUDIX family)